MQVSRSPTARWTSAAATAESTPPDSAQMTLPSEPVARACASTRSRIALTVDSMKFAGVQLGAIPAMPVTKLRRTSRPRGVWTTSGWNWIPYRFRAGASRPAYGVESVCAVAWKPSGSRVIESPWLIQTGCSRSMPPNSPSSRVIWTVAGPYSRRVAGVTSPPSSSAISWAP